MFKIFNLEMLNSTPEGRFKISILVGLFVTLFLDTYVNLVDELLIPLIYPNFKNIVLIKNENKIKLGKVLMSVIKFVLLIMIVYFLEN
jgi:hypothetical protein